MKTNCLFYSNKRTIALKLFSFLLIFVTLLFSSCNSKEQFQQNKDVSSKKEISITATFYPLYVMALNVTKDIPNIKVQMMAPKATGCLHDYQLTVNDMQLLQDSDIIIANGAGMESFLEKVLATKKDSLIILTEGIKLIEEPEENVSQNEHEEYDKAEHEHDKNEDNDIEDHEHHHHSENPHVWVSISGAIEEVKNLTIGLSKLDTDNAKLYQKNEQEYIQKLTNLVTQMKEKLLPYAGQEIITFHEAFPYFAQEFGFNIVGTLITEDGYEPSPREVSDIIKMIKEKQAKGKQVLLFTEPQYEERLANTIAIETGISVYSLDPCVTGELSLDSYILAMEKNLQTLVTACSKTDKTNDPFSKENSITKENNSL